MTKQQYNNNFYKYINQNNKTGDFVDKYMQIIQDGLLDDPELNPVDEPDIVDAYDEDILEDFPEEDAIENEELDEVNEEVEEVIDDKEGNDFIGFDTDPDVDFINEDLQQKSVDVGINGDIRGRRYDYEDFESNDFIKVSSKINKNKILMINDRDSFDVFTSKYGELNREENKIFIKWKEVTKNYKGIYITTSCLGSREEDIPFKDKVTKENWLNYDYNYLDEVIIFIRERSLIHAKHIETPFKGKVVDEYAVSEDEFVDIHEKNGKDKILLIDDVADFDKFTNLYGSLKTKKNKTHIQINWKKVNRDYDGFYINKDNDFYQDRYRKAFLNDKKYNSWLKYDNIMNGLVYLF
jgi:hypothetical protein